MTSPNLHVPEGKVLLISQAGVSVSGLETIGWNDDIPNVADYDVIILDLVTLRGGIEVGDLTFDPRRGPSRDQVNLLLWSEGGVVCIMPPVNELKSKQRGSVSPYWWSPIPLGNDLQGGDTRNVLDDSCERYFSSGVREWGSTLHLKEEDAEGYSKGTFIRYRIDPLVVSRYDFPMAGEASMEMWLQPRFDGSGPVKQKDSWPILVLPETDLVSTEEAISIVLQDIIGLAVETPPPSWIHDIEYPGERKLQAEIDRLEGEIDSLRERMSQVRLDLQTLRSYKRLLYEDGDALADTVAEAFTKMGAIAHTSEIPGREDRWIEFPGLEPIAALEVKGHTHGMSRADARQADDWSRDLMDRMDQQVKGILAGNPFRNRPPDARDSPWPPNVVSYARNAKLGLVTTEQIFDALVKVEGEKMKSIDFFRSLLEASGPIKP